MKALHDEDFPVPEPLYLSTDEDEELFGTPFFIRDYVEVIIHFIPILCG